MKVAYFTEVNFNGKYPRNFPNARTDVAWQIALNADHYYIFNSQNLPKTYDLGVIIIPKNLRNDKLFNISTFKQYCKKIVVQQEGPATYFQDYPIEQQIWYLNTLLASDGIFVHNEKDLIYFKGLTNHKHVYVLQSLMIEDQVKNVTTLSPKLKPVIIGGNFVSWYGGMDSYVVAREVSNEVWAPSMGRKKDDEKYLVKHLPYVQWNEWISQLSTFRIAVHLMRTHAAGTFALNCAYLAIPCIGYEGLDTQQICHPNTTVKVGDLITAKEKINVLNTDNDFYNMCSFKAREMYDIKFSEKVWLKKFSSIVEQIMDRQ